MNTFKTTSLADQVFERLENDIIMGVYSRGEILTELKLVEQLGVSRTPIREALRRLEQERLIADSGKGSIVLGISEEDLLDIMDIRIYVEGLASYYATGNATPEDLKELAHIMELQQFYCSKQDSEHLRQMDDAFHNYICQISRRSVIRDTLIPLHRKTKRYRKASIQDENRTKLMLEEHMAIFEAIAASDARKAQQLTMQHIEKAKDNMIKRLNNNG